MTQLTNARLILLFGLATCVCAPSSTAETTNCSLTSLKGAYGFTLNGSFIPAGVTYATTGRFVSNGNGAVKGSVVESVNGNVSSGNFTATYTVAVDCTGTAVFTFGGGLQSGISFTIVSDGREVLLIDTDPGTVETGSAKKQFDDLER